MSLDLQEVKIFTDAGRAMRPLYVVDSVSCNLFITSLIYIYIYIFVLSVCSYCRIILLLLYMVCAYLDRPWGIRFSVRTFGVAFV